ncbi:MAG: NAD(P)H-dependent oxidoreductase subunit E [Actinobacteria bacterium]|nr:NAD(P)H-dependent oxidoreductase subunit E [Actinomycetota bacterium]
MSAAPQNELRHEDSVPQLADVSVPAELKAWIEERMAMYPEPKSATIPCLMHAQKLHGWLSPDAVRQVAAVMRVTPAYLVSVASFYDMFELKPRGRHTIYMCTNISCMLRGADAVMAELEAQVGVDNGGTSDDGIYLRNFECLGACDIAPMASVDGTYIGPLTVADAKALVEDLRAERDVLPEKHLTRRPAAATYWAAGKRIEQGGER